MLFLTFGKHKWKTIKDVELYLGKPKSKNDKPHWETKYYSCFKTTYQYDLYVNISKSYQNNSEILLTIDIDDYNTLMEFN